MQELHFVGFTSNHEGLLLSPHEDATSGDYFVQIDEYLAAAIEQRPGASSDGQNREEQHAEAQQPREEPRAVAPAAPAPRPVARTRPKPASHLSPREIQARLRGGSSVAEVAHEAAVDEEWVLRFADPILAEQSRVVQRALQLTFTKPRVGPSSQPLRESVRWNLADQGALRDDEAFDAGWTAFNLQGASKWAVRFSFSAKRRRKVAEWEVDLRQGELKARNRVATDLGYVEPTRRRKPPPEELPPAPSPGPRARRQRGRDKGAQKARANKKVTANKAAKAAKRGPASKAATRPAKKGAPKAAAKKSATKAGARTAGRAAAATKSAVRKQAPKKSAPKRATEPRKASKKVTAKKKAAAKATA